MAKRGKAGLPLATRRSQLPLMLGQLKMLTRLAATASEQAKLEIGPGQFGAVLTANTLAGLALELGLKALITVSTDVPPPAVHQLDILFGALPPPVRAQVENAYERHPRRTDAILAAAFQIAPSAPETPERGEKLSSYATAGELFRSASTIFIASRYFFERIGEGGWAHMDHPIGQMLAMIDAMGSVYDGVVTGDSHQ